MLKDCQAEAEVSKNTFHTNNIRDKAVLSKFHSKRPRKVQINTKPLESDAFEDLKTLIMDIM